MSNFFEHRRKSGVNPGKRVRNFVNQNQKYRNALKKEIKEYAKIDNVKLNNVKLEEAIISTDNIENHTKRVYKILNIMGKKLPTFTKNIPKNNTPNISNILRMARIMASYSAAESVVNNAGSKTMAFKKNKDTFLNRIKN